MNSKSKHLHISLSFFTFMLLLLLFESPNTMGDWGYPGVEYISWENEDTIYFQYRFEIFRHGTSDGEIVNIYSSPANYELIRNGSMMVLSDRHLPSCTGFQPSCTLKTQIINIEENKTIQIFENISGYSVNHDGSQIIIKIGMNISTYNLPEMDCVSFQNTGLPGDLRTDYINWGQGNNMIALMDGHYVSIMETSSMNELKRIPTRYRDFGFSPDGAYFHTREEIEDLGYPLTVWNTNTWEKAIEIDSAMSLDHPWGSDYFYYRTDKTNNYWDDNRTYRFLSTEDWTEIKSFDVEERSDSTITWNSNFSFVNWNRAGRRIKVI